MTGTSHTFVRAMGSAYAGPKMMVRGRDLAEVALVLGTCRDRGIPATADHGHFLAAVGGRGRWADLHLRVVLCMARIRRTDVSSRTTQAAGQA